MRSAGQSSILTRTDCFFRSKTTVVVLHHVLQYQRNFLVVLRFPSIQEVVVHSVKGDHRWTTSLPEERYPLLVFSFCLGFLSWFPYVAFLDSPSPSRTVGFPTQIWLQIATPGRGLGAFPGRPGGWTRGRLYPDLI